MKHKLTFLIVLLNIGIQARCQIIGLKDVPPYGSYFVFSEVTDTFQLNHFVLTKKIHDNIWDFSKLETNMEDTAWYFDTKSTALDTIYNHPSFRIRWNKDEGSYIYKVDSNGQYELGNYTTPLNNYQYEKPVLMVKFPLQLGTENSDTVQFRYDFYGWEVDTGLFDSTCALSRGNLKSSVISDGKMYTNSDTFVCILVKQIRSSYKYKLYKQHNQDWKIIDSSGYLDISTSYFLYSNSIEPVARVYPTTYSDTGVYAMQYLRRSVLKTSVKKIEPEESTIVYPNPAINLLNVKIRGEENFYFNIIDITGKNIKSGLIGHSQKTIDISELNNGFYYLLLSNEDKTSVHKFIKG